MPKVVRRAGVSEDVGVVTSPDGTQFVCFEIKGSHDAEIACAASKSPIQVRMRLIIDIRDRPVGEHDL
jgi:hypothetical protein